MSAAFFFSFFLSIHCIGWFVLLNSLLKPFFIAGFNLCSFLVCVIQAVGFPVFKCLASVKPELYLIACRYHKLEISTGSKHVLLTVTGWACRFVFPVCNTHAVKLRLKYPKPFVYSTLKNTAALQNTCSENLQNICFIKLVWNWFSLIYVAKSFVIKSIVTSHFTSELDIKWSLHMNAQSITTLGQDIDRHVRAAICGVKRHCSYTARSDKRSIVNSDLTCSI